MVADALSCKDQSKPLQVRALEIWHAQTQTMNKSKLPGKGLHGNEKSFVKKTDDMLYFKDRVWIPVNPELRHLLMDEAHKSKYSIHPGTDRMYHDLKDFYWGPGMKKDVAEYLSQCLTYA